MTWLDRFIPPNLFESPEARIRARFLVGWSLASLLLTVAAMIYRAGSGPKWGIALLMGFFCLVGFGSVPALLRKTGSLKLAGSLPATGLLLAVAGLSLFHGGLLNQSLAAILVVPFFAAIFMGYRLAGFFTALCVLFLIFASAGHSMGWYDTAAIVQNAQIPFRLMVMVMASLFIFALVYMYEQMQHQISERLKENEARLALAVSATNDGLFDWNIKTQETYFSPTFLALLGYDEEPEGLRSPFDEFFYSPASHSRVELALKKHLQERSHFDLETKMRDIHGKERWFHIRGGAVWEGNEATRMVGFIRDISNQKQLERIKEEFISNVGHEFRTPLTSIIGAIRLMSQQGVLDEDQQAEMLQIAHRNSEQLLTLVDDLLDLQKLQSGPIPLTKIWADLPSLAEEAAAELKPSCEKKHITVEWEIAPTVPPLSLDPDRLRQALKHLLFQAIKHSPKRETISIAIVRARPRKDGAEEVTLSVSDKGPGIAPEDQPYVFDRLAHWDMAKQSQGTGLGMALAKRIAEAHGGTLGFTTGPDEGTTFKMRLPLETASTEDPPEANTTSYGSP